MRWLQTDYLVKGVFLGLLVYAALVAPSWQAAGFVGLCLLIGLTAGVALAAVLRFGAGERPRGRPGAFLLLVILESPVPVTAGLLLGLLAGVLEMPGVATDNTLLAYTAGGGAVLGLVLGALREIPQRLYRLLVAGVVVGLLGYLAVTWLNEHPGTLDEERRATVGLLLLASLPFFYLLTFVSGAEESEAEIALLCAAMGLGIWLLQFPPRMPAIVGMLIPLVVYVLYSMFVLPGFRVFKHTLRGIGYVRTGRVRPALVALRRAVELDPGNALARGWLWRAHRGVNLDQAVNDPQTLALLDYDLCLNRAANLLVGERPPTEAERDEAGRLLALVDSQRPHQRAQVAYYRAVLAAHAGRLDEAGEQLARLLDPAAWPADDPGRRDILLPAWQLALTLHPGLSERVGRTEVAKPGRRLEAIAAVERKLAADPEDAAAHTLKRVLYSELTETEYSAAPDGGEPLAGARADFDHVLALQLGQELIGQPERWRRGAEYLRVAARGLPAQRPGVFRQLAEAAARAGDAEAARDYRRQAKAAGLAATPANLPDDQKQAFYESVRQLAEEAAARSDLQAAIDDYRLYSDYDRGPKLETLRTLADLYERTGQALPALWVTEQARLYSKNDPDLLSRRERYYYSVTPEQLRAASDAVRAGLDADYCIATAKKVLDNPHTDLDALDWAAHLVEVARVLKPGSLAAQVLAARALMQRGEDGQALQILEDVREARPGTFSSGEESDAWYTACRELGDLYMSDKYDRPDLAVGCYVDFRTSPRSGAKTLYKLGQAYEKTGERAKAKQCYEQVLAFENNPLAYDAREALQRLRAG
jgi:hypothetical protein